MPHPHGGFNQAAQAAFFIGVNVKNVKKNTRPRGAKKAPSQPTTPLTVPRRETVERPDPDPEDLAIADAEDPCLDEPGVLFRPELRFVSE